LESDKEQNAFSKSYTVTTFKRTYYSYYQHHHHHHHHHHHCYYYSPSGILMATADIYFEYMLHYSGADVEIIH
jgi:hypothetical protein